MSRGKARSAEQSRGGFLARMKTPVRRIFDEIPQTYDVTNRVLTLGLDVLWRRKAARVAASDGGVRWLDVCTGTGDMIASLKRVAPEGCRLTALDFSLPMLRTAAAKPGLEDAGFVWADVSRLPFPEATFDLVTISFATRNINTGRPALLHRLREIRRVLRPGGRFVNLETSQPPWRLVRAFMHDGAKGLLLVIRKVVIDADQ